MEDHRRRPRPPRIEIGDNELSQRLPEDRAALEGNTLVDRRDVDFTSLEQRYAEALTDSHQSRRTRDELSKPEGMHHGVYPPQTEAGQRTSGQQSGASTPGSDTEFDWDETDSSDEETVEAAKHAKEEHIADVHRHNVKRAKRLRKVYLACIRLSRPVRTLLFALLGSGILIIPAVVIWARFDSDASTVVKDNVKVWSLWLTIVWASGCGTSIFVDAIPFMISKISVLLVGLYPQAVQSKVILFDGAKFWLKAILTCVWAWISLSVLSDRIFKADYLDYFRWVLHVVQSFFASSIVLYVEKLIVQSVKASFHQNALKDRIEENARALWALDKLAASRKKTHPKLPFRGFQHSRAGSTVNTPAPSRPTSRAGSPEHNKEHHVALQLPRQIGTRNGKEGDTVVDVPLTPRGEGQSFGDRPPNLRQRSNKSPNEPKESDGSKELGEQGGRTGSSTPDHFKGHRTPRYFRRRANSKTISEQLAEALSQATLKDKSRNTSQTQHSAKKMAKRLFEGLGKEKAVLTPNDFRPYFATRADAEVAFTLFDKDGNGDISKKEMRSAVQRIYREKKALKASLSDMGSAVSRLDAVLLGVCFVIILFIFFLIFNRTATVSSLTSISTIVAALSFIFSNAASTLFNSMVFIFSTQPFAIGDLIFIDTDPLIVKEFGLMSTVFERVDGQYIIAPNSVLSTSKHILNVRRSGSMWETTNIQIAFNTPLEVISELRSKLRQYVQEESREWGGGLDVNVNNINNQNYIDLIVALQHKGNWQDWGGRWNRRTKLMRQMKMILDDLGVTYSLPLQPVQLSVRGGPSPLAQRRGSNGSGGNAATGNGNNNGLSFDTRFLSPDALGNGAQIGVNSFRPTRDGTRTADGAA